MQGTAADLIKKAMVAVQARLDAEKPEVLVIMQVHDELVFELPEFARGLGAGRDPGHHGRRGRTVRAAAGRDRLWHKLGKSPLMGPS